MISGELREKVKIMCPIPQVREEGDIFSDVQQIAVPCDYEYLFTLQAGVKWKTGDESYIENQTTVIQSVRFKVRYCTKVVETHAVEYKNCLYNIKFIEQNKFEGTTYIHTERMV